MQGDIPEIQLVEGQLHFMADINVDEEMYMIKVNWLQTSNQPANSQKNNNGSSCEINSDQKELVREKIDYSSIPVPFRPLIKRYQDLFQMPTQLPPAREMDHSIPLWPNTKPISCRPYRYSHYQQKEIYKILKELIQQQFIRPSSSPFASPYASLLPSGDYAKTTGTSNPFAGGPY